ncbi:class I SAM-dependent methyltransferase [Thermosynechococcus vestitus]|uniref:class I SAM-dependent methyltransferase n=1 Tax=Thermosynechococcus vestitus TaxID=146786 RepID=UPI0013E89E8B|nr:class I SAM-dependent methyltransferase [Thermosynechococcus vestitus]
MDNVDTKTVQSFGDEWLHFDQSILDKTEYGRLFESYFRIFPWDSLPQNSWGFDMGCGSGRWARGVAAKVGHLTCIDPSSKALAAAKRNLAVFHNISFINASTSDMPLEPNSQDFGYSLGVLHHLPDTTRAQKC